MRRFRGFVGFHFLLDLHQLGGEALRHDADCLQDADKLL
jgi:hypothetical protein